MCLWLFELLIQYLQLISWNYLTSRQVKVTSEISTSTDAYEMWESKTEISNIYFDTCLWISNKVSYIKLTSIWQLSSDVHLSFIWHLRFDIHLSYILQYSPCPRPTISHSGLQWHRRRVRLSGTYIRLQEYKITPTAALAKGRCHFLHVQRWAILCEGHDLVWNNYNYNNKSEIIDGKPIFLDEITN